MTTNDEFRAQGYVPLTRFVGRFLAGASLPAPGAGSIKAIPANSRRLELVIFNDGSASGYWDTVPNVTNVGPEIPSGASRNWDDGPANALYLAGDAGADLRVEETILVHPNDSRVSE